MTAALILIGAFHLLAYGAVCWGLVRGGGS